VGKGDVFWEFCFGFVDVELVGNVREVSFSSSERFCCRLRFCEIHVGGVWPPVEAVNNQNGNIHEEFTTFFGDGFDIGDIGDGWHARVVEAIPLRFLVSVNDGDGGDGEVAKLERAVRGVGIGFDVSFVSIGREKCPAEHALDFIEAGLGSVERERSFTLPAECSEFIKPGDMIEMGVGVEHGIHFSEPFAECLLAEVGAAIDKD